MPRVSNWPSRAVLEETILSFIAEHGLTQWSLRTLATHLGVSTYTLTYHFGSKEQLIGVILTNFENRMQSMMAEWAQEQKMTTSALIQRYWEWLLLPENTSFGQTFFEIYGQALRNPAQFAPFLASGFPSWMELLQQRLELEGLHTPSPAILSSILVSSVTGLYLDWLTLHDTRRTTETIEYLCQWVNDLLSQKTPGM